MSGPSAAPIRLAIFVTHPIQYFAPIWRGLAAVEGVDLTVHFFSDHSVRGGTDSGFGVAVKWDVPLLEGYRHVFVSREADLYRPGSVRMQDAERVLKEGGFTHVMVHGYTFGFERQVVRSARRLGVCVVQRGEMSDVVPYGGRSALKTLVRNAYLRWFYRYIDAFCAIGEEAREHLLRRGIGADRIFFSPYSVDTALFEAQKRSFGRAESRGALGIGEGQMALLFSGKLIPRKAPMLLIEALKQIERPERVTLILLGDGELRGEVEAAGRPLLGDRLILPGFVNQSQLGQYFMAADAFVLPSHHETWGLVVNEAMQFGLPVVVSERVGCHKDLVLPSTGLVHRDGDAADLARCLEALLSDPARAREMGEHARERIAGYSTQASVEGIVRALRFAASR